MKTVLLAPIICTDQFLYFKQVTEVRGVCVQHIPTESLRDCFED